MRRTSKRTATDPLGHPRRRAISPATSSTDLLLLADQVPRRGRVPVLGPGRSSSRPVTAWRSPTGRTPHWPPTTAWMWSTWPRRTPSTTTPPGSAWRPGRAVLVEKPFTVTAAETARLIALATSQRLFAMEAMWTRFNPIVREVTEPGARGRHRPDHRGPGRPVRSARLRPRQTGCGTRRWPAARCSTSGFTRCRSARCCSARRTQIRAVSSAGAHRRRRQHRRDRPVPGRCGRSLLLRSVGQLTARWPRSSGPAARSRWGTAVLPAGQLHPDSVPAGEPAHPRRSPCTGTASPMRPPKSHAACGPD